MKNLTEVVLTGLFSVLSFAMVSVGLVDWPWQKPADSLEALQTQTKANVQKTSAEVVALDLLKKAKGIESDRIGPGARTADTFKMYQVLDESEQSNTLFIELLHSSNPVAQSYGLIGLHEKDHLLYQKYLPTFLSSHIKIEVQNGCMSEMKEVSDINFQKHANHFNEAIASRALF